MTNEELKAKFSEYFKDTDGMRIFSAAGRVNLIGEHIDYNGGCVFPAALDLSCRIVARKNNSNNINIAFTTLNERLSLDISRLDDYRKNKVGCYQAGVAKVLEDEGFTIVGCDLLYHTTVPFGSGLSSSAAIEVATALCLATFSNEKNNITKELDLVRLSVLAQKAENTYVGVNCGIMDQFASAMGKKNCAIRLDCATLDYQYVPLELGDYALVIINSNKPRSLADSKYNERRAECDEAVKILSSKKSGLKYLCELSEAEFEGLKDLLTGKIRDRAEHAVRENARVFKSIEALKKGDILQFGQLLNASHKSLKELYEVTGSELDCLAETAVVLDGCIGARMTGAGFGGCAIAIVKKDKVKAFIKQLDEIYTKKTGLKAAFYDTAIADGAYEA